MESLYKVGDKVRIKERVGSIYDYPLGFIDRMAELAGKVFTVKLVKNIDISFYSSCPKYNGDNYWYELEEDNATFWWHSSMFERVQDYLFNVGDSIKVRNFNGKIVRFSSVSPKHYVSFSIDTEKHKQICNIIEEAVPNYRKFAKECNSIYPTAPFPAFSNIDDLISFINKVNDSSDNTFCNNLKTVKENEIRFQKPKTSISRGSVPEGRNISGKKGKIAISSGYLSYRVCNF